MVATATLLQALLQASGLLKWSTSRPHYGPILISDCGPLLLQTVGHSTPAMAPDLAPVTQLVCSHAVH